MLNRVNLIGNLGHDPEIRTMQDGREIAILSLATHSSWKNGEGEWQKTTQWHRIIVYRPDLVLWVKESLKKGESLYVEGRLTYAEFEDKITQKKRKIAHVVISGREGQLKAFQSKKPTPEEELEEREEMNESLESFSDSFASDLEDQLPTHN